MTGSQFIESLDANLEDELSSKSTPATSTAAGTRAGMKTRLSLNARDDLRLLGRGSEVMTPMTLAPDQGAHHEATTSITASMPAFLKMLSPPLPLLLALSWDFARVRAMAYTF